MDKRFSEMTFPEQLSVYESALSDELCGAVADMQCAARELRRANLFETADLLAASITRIQVKLGRAQATCAQDEVES